jgi:hypothetical protein
MNVEWPVVPCELDLHADTCVAGSNCVIIETTNQTVSVSAFSEAHEIIHNVPIVTAATAYDDNKTGVTYITWTSHLHGR